MAILFNVVLKWLEKAKLRTIVAAFAVMVLGLGASYAPSMIPNKEKENLVIAGKLGPEPEILMNMYKLLIEENTDMTVTVKPNFGKTDFLYQALKRVISISIQNFLEQ